MREQGLVAAFALLGLAAACSSSSSPGPAARVAPTASSIKHLVVVVQENHSFDAYFGGYCTAATGSNPTCTTGPACCEAAPSKDPGTGMAPVVLNDMENGTFDPNHTQACELAEIDDGKMDKYVTAPGLPGVPCGSPNNFAQIDPSTAGPYWNLAKGNALADQYFQPVAGQSSSNDIYLARAAFEFLDNDDEPESIGSSCQAPATAAKFTDQTIGDLLDQANVPWGFYAAGYQAALDAAAKSPTNCAPIPSDCSAHLQAYPCVYDPGDNPFEYFQAFEDNPKVEFDFATFGKDVTSGTLPGVAFVKAIGYESEHPGYGDEISPGSTFVTSVVSTIMGSPYAKDTLILVTWDESGGFFDHVAPPPMSAIDKQPYGPRIPLLAIGAFARQNFISHTMMEHSSIVKFIEWNWLAEKTGQLGTRDTTVNNIGSMLDPMATGVAVPEE